VARLTEQLRDWLARAEILARGAERARAEAARALESGKPWVARYEALAILEELPRSPVALALWADAAEATYLDHEVEEALERLAAELPFRADVWLRLAEARGRLGLEPTAALSRAVEAGEPAEAADEARLALAERDLDRGDAPRALSWLAQLSIVTRTSARAALRHLEARLDVPELVPPSSAPEPNLLDARGWLAVGRLCARLGDVDRAVLSFGRALILDAEHSTATVADFVASSPPARAVERVRALVEAMGAEGEPVWRAAFARAAGAHALALEALDAASACDAAYVPRLLDASLGALDAPTLLRAVERAQVAGLALEPAVLELARALELPLGRERLAKLDEAVGRAAPFADHLRREVYESWLPSDATNFVELSRELAMLAQALDMLPVLEELEAIHVDLARPLRVAVVGEFNAGKSSLINALLGENVAPVGILPTTSTPNHLVWAPDRVARIERVEGSGEPDRVVQHADLEHTLAELDSGSVARVTIYAPLEFLRRLELIDTPGFNAPEQDHTRAARSALEEAHVAIWLFDATQPMKESERRELAALEAHGIPLLVMVNKIDRLLPEDLDAALRHVNDGLAAAGITSLAPPVAISTRLALLGKRGAEHELVRSRWVDVERLVEAELYQKSSRLRERALRHRALAVAARLDERAESETAARRQQTERVNERRAALQRALTTVHEARDEIERELEEAAVHAASVLATEVAPALALRDSAPAERFISARARDVLARVWLERTERRLRLDDALPSELAVRLGAVAATGGRWLLEKAERPASGAAARHLAGCARQEVLLSLERAVAGIRLPEPRAVERRARLLARVLATKSSR
jgi:small GTP-binding protein